MISDWLSGKRKLAESADAPDSRQHFDVWNFTGATDVRRILVLILLTFVALASLLLDDVGLGVGALGLN